MDKNIKLVVKEESANAKPMNLEGVLTMDAELPALPEVTANKTYALQLVNGVKSWVEVQG